MGGAATFLLMLSAMAVLLVGVESQQRVCYSGPPPEPDPDNPDDWMKQVMQEIRKRCPRTSTDAVVTTPSAECPSPAKLGMEDGTIPDNHITASSSWPANPPEYGRLNHYNAWGSTTIDTNPWIQVNLDEGTVVTGLITQGRFNRYVKQYKVAYKKQPSTPFQDVTDENGNIKVFIGNSDESTPVTNLFDESVVATIARITPTDWEGSTVNLRFELLGCRRE